MGFRILLFRFFVHGMFLAPVAILFELYFALNLFLVFARKIVSSFTNRTVEFYQVWLGHEYP